MHTELKTGDARPLEIIPYADAAHRREREAPSRNEVARPRVSVVIAALNEAANLAHVLPAIPDDVFEVILVDGHSTDGTVEVARRLRPQVRVIIQDARGKGDALRCGFAAARGEIIVAMDADGSTDPRELPAFVGALLAGADYAKGSRFIPGAGTSDMTFTRKFGNRGLLLLVRALFKKRYTDLCYGYFALWKRCLPALQLQSDGFEIETELNVRAAVTKLKVVEVASFEHPRIAGEAHLRPWSDGWRVLSEILRQRRRPAGAAPARATSVRGYLLED